MFWFISPWEAASRSFELQRQVMALPWIFFASAQRQEGLSARDQTRSEDSALPGKSVAPARQSPIPARRAMETIKKPLSARSKHKRSRRKKKK
jgi:hypothetical protein